MADALRERLARRLADVATATPTGQGFWETLADVAATECNRTVVITQATLPAEPFIALVAGTREVIARGRVMLDLQASIEDYLQRRGSGDVWILEVKRVYTAS